MATVVLGVDPGGQYTGLVLRRGTQLIDHLTITRGYLTMAKHLLNVVEAVRIHLAQANLLAVEDLNEPNPHMGLASVRGLLDTAQVLGAITSHWPTAVVVPPGKHGSNPLLAYPPALRPSREAIKWVGWRGWHQVMADLGYEHVVLSHNSMHHGVPQSRDRIYVVFWRQGLKPDLELELQAWCSSCEARRAVRQAWKPGRTIGRYRQQWVWQCVTCAATCEPSTEPAASIIDWGLPCPRIGDRARPLAEATRARILAGLQRYGWVPVVTAGAGHVYETTPGNRARPLTEPLPVQGATSQHAMATPPGFLVQPHHSGADDARVRSLDEPTWTVTASDDRPAFVVPMRSGRNRSHTVDEPMATVTAGGHYGGLVVHLRGTDPDQIAASATPVDEPVRTVSAGGIHHGLLMRNNKGGPEMVTPTSEPARTMTTKGHQSLIVPYYGQGQAQSADRPLPTVRTRDAHALIDPDQLVDDCGFRMLEPHEIAAAMAFPHGYIPEGLTKRDRVKLAGNAVTPPVMQWICGRLLQALEAAA